MPRTRLRAEQIVDADIVTDIELAAGFKTDQVVSDVFPISVASTDSGTKTVTLASGGAEEWLQEGDVAEISGGTPAGDYTVVSIVSDTEFTVEEAIPDSTSEGSFTAYHAIGATKIGVNDTNLSNVTADRLQLALEEIDSQLGAGVSPDDIGDVLYSVDGSNFTSETPIVSCGGWLVSETGLHIVQG